MKAILLLCLLTPFSLFAQNAQIHVKRTYYDYRGQHLHEEYQYIRTPTTLEAKNGYYKEYNENGNLVRKYNYLKDKLNGTCTDYDDFDNGYEPSRIVTYRMGVEHGYSALWQYNTDTHKRFKSMEGSRYNSKPDGRWTSWDSDGSRTVENWKRGTREGETVMYNSSGERVREGYYDKNEPLTGTLEEKFENGRLSKSVNYEEGLRSGLTQTWYTNGQLKSQTRYENGRKSGPTLTYLENGEPDAATKAALIQLAREAEAAKADSIQQAHNEALELRRVLIEHHKQDSLRKEQERHMFD